jgi:hypothetical protein
MGILDALFGIRKLSPPRTDDLFKLPPACVTMESALDIKPSGKAGICFRAFDTKNFEDVKGDIVGILNNSDFKGRYGVVEDEYRFTWVVLENPSADDLTAGIHMVSQLLIDGGYGEHILCAVFEFKKYTQALYWVYNYRRGRFYPFVPQNNKERDVALEFRLKTLVSDELPIDSLDYWYPIWGIPF